MKILNGLTINALSGVLKATAGVVSGGATTSDLTEGTNLYYSDVRVKGCVLTGFIAGANTAIAATDTILAALQKVQGQITAREGTIAAGTTAQYYRGDKTWQTLNQAAVAGLTSGSSPTFSGLTLNGRLDHKSANVLRFYRSDNLDWYEIGAYTGGLQINSIIKIQNSAGINALIPTTDNVTALGITGSAWNSATIGSGGLFLNGNISIAGGSSRTLFSDVSSYANTVVFGTFDSTTFDINNTKATVGKVRVYGTAGVDIRVSGNDPVAQFTSGGMTLNGELSMGTHSISSVGDVKITSITATYSSRLWFQQNGVRRWALISGDGSNDGRFTLEQYSAVGAYEQQALYFAPTTGNATFAGTINSGAITASGVIKSTVGELRLTNGTAANGDVSFVAGNTGGANYGFGLYDRNNSVYLFSVNQSTGNTEILGSIATDSQVKGSNVIYNIFSSINLAASSSGSIVGTTTWDETSTAYKEKISCYYRHRSGNKTVRLVASLYWTDDTATDARVKMLIGASSVELTQSNPATDASISGTIDVSALTNGTLYNIVVATKLTGSVGLDSATLSRVVIDVESTK